METFPDRTEAVVALAATSAWPAGRPGRPGRSRMVRALTGGSSWDALAVVRYVRSRARNGRRDESESDRARLP